MSKQSERRRSAFVRQSQAEQAGRFRGFAAIVHEPGREPRVLASKPSTPPPAESLTVGELPFLRFRVSSDPLLSATGAPSVEQLERMLDEQAAELAGPGDELLAGWQSRTTIVPSGAIDL